MASATINLRGPSVDPALPIIYPVDINNAVNAALLANYNAAMGNGPFLPLTGGTLTGSTILTTNTRVGMDTAALGGVPNMYMYSDGGAFTFYADGWNEWTPSAFRGINFKIFGNGGADSYWGATGGPENGGATLKVYTVSGGFPCVGSILASNEGQLYLGNDNGTILNLQGSPGSISSNNVLITAAGSGSSPSIRATGEDGVSLALGGTGYGSVVAGTSNGPTLVISDASQATGHQRTAYFVMTAPTGSANATIGLSTAGIPSPPATLSMAIDAIGAGSVIFGNNNGPIALAYDASFPGDARTSYLLISGGSSGDSPGITVTTAGIPSPPASASFSISAWGAGSVVFSNSNGPIALAYDPSPPSTPKTSYLRISGGSSGVTPGIAVTTAGVSSPPDSVDVFLTSWGGGAVDLGNSNGPIAVFNDPVGASGNTRTSYFILTPGSSGHSPIITLSTSGIISPPADQSITLQSLGTGEVAFVTGGGKQARVLDHASAVVSVDMYGAVSGGSPVVTASAGNLLLGQSGLATTTTAGMIQLPTCPGTPTGVPVNAGAGATLIYDNSSAHKLWVYDGSSWRGVALT